MRAMRTWWVVAAVALAMGPVGCAGNKRGPVAASSTGEAQYAARFPEELDGLVSRFHERQSEAKKVEQGFAAYPDQVKDVKKSLHLAIIDRADQSGRGQSYADAQHEGEQVRRFFKEEKDEINKKVGGSVAFAAKQKGCPFDGYGVSGQAIGEAVDKQLEERSRAHNEGFALIERNRVALKAQATPLEKQADEVSLASFIVYVEAVEMRETIARQAGEGSAIKRTADDFIQQERAFQAEPGRTPEEKKASDQRIEAMTRSKGRVDFATQRAQQTLDTMEQSIKDGQKAYADSLAALRAKLK